MRKQAVARWNELRDKQPSGALVENVDLVIIRYGDEVSVLYGRCLHRGALLADGHVSGKDLICGVHNWDYRVDTGISAYNNSERLPKFSAWIEDGEVLVDADEIADWEARNPQPFDRDAYLGQYADTHGTEDEPHNGLIQSLARNGLLPLSKRIQAWNVPPTRKPVEPTSTEPKETKPAGKESPRSDTEPSRRRHGGCSRSGGSHTAAGGAAGGTAADGPVDREEFQRKSSKLADDWQKQRMTG